MLRDIPKVLRGRGAKNNRLILIELALSDTPLHGYALRSRIESLADEGTVYKRLRALSTIDRPFIRKVGTAKSKRGKQEHILYDLTIRGGVTALVLIPEDEVYLKKYAKRFGWGENEGTMLTIGEVANDERFWPLAKQILLYLKHEPLLYHSLEDGDDLGLLQVIEKDVFRIAATKLKAEASLSNILAEANRMLASKNLRTFEDL